MPIEPGTRLGPYEILSPLGAGGMGEVYRARDTRLDRTVAVKVLPSHLAAAPALRERFEREARAVSSLNHPNICSLYDIGRHEGTDYLVMEHIEGETLAARLKKGPLTPEQALRFAVQIADALGKAHHERVVHRDLKPGNIMITKTGAKLLDFGLAKLRPAQPDGTLPGSSALMTRRGDDLTAEGSIVGTLQYMSPEQLEGKEADARSDIFSFGSVLYEMITGAKAFDGKSQASVIGAILHTEPQPVSSIRPMTPRALERVVRRCLAKDPDERWQSAGDLAAEIRWIAETASQPDIAQPAGGGSSRSRTLYVAALAGLGLVFLAALPLLLYLSRGPATASRPTLRFSVNLSTGSSLALYGAPNIALSPDGRWLAFVAERNGAQRIYLRAADRLEATPVPGTESGASAFFSPDSRWLGFAAGGKLRKVPVTGGPVETICDAVEVHGASWAADGTIVFATGTSGLRKVPASGGAATNLIAPMEGGTSLMWPDMIRGSDAVLFTSLEADGTHVRWASTKTGEVHLIGDGSGARYAPDGHLLYMKSGALMAVPFDAKKMEMTGPPVSLIETIMVIPPLRLALFDISQEGTLVYAPGGGEGLMQSLVMVDRQGKAAPLAFPPRNYEEPRISPDGSRFAVTLRDNNPDIWIGDFARGTLTRLTFSAGEDETPIWTPDGRRVTYTSAQTLQARTVYWKSADGSSDEQQVFFTENHPHLGSWSPDGRSLAYTDFSGAFSGDIWVDRPGATPALQPVVHTPFNECAPRLSPSGDLMAYVSDASGRDEVYVQAFPGPGGRWQISTEGGSEPVWSRDGKALLYRVGDNMMEVAVTTRPAFSAGAPKILFSGRYQPTRRGDAAYDVAPDGKFLMVRRNDDTALTSLVVLLDWPAVVRRAATAQASP